MTPHLKVDIVILGGGIAGLWTLSRLRALKFQAILLEPYALGHGQTLCAQGIIHGGTKYSVHQTLSQIGQDIKEMPTRWRNCFNGTGEIDLSSVKLLSTHQHLWVPPSLRGKFVGFLTSKMMRSRVNKLKRGSYPEVFQPDEFQGEVYQLDEPVVDVHSLMSRLREINLPYLGQISPLMKFEGHTFITDALHITANTFILTAGEANRLLNPHVSMQLRPLHMLMLKNMPHLLYAHCVDEQFRPQLSITSHEDEDRNIIWYLGGEIAEQGNHQTSRIVAESGLRQIQQLLPWLDLSRVSWQTKMISRAEYQQVNGKIPPGPYVHEENGFITAWPTKLAYAPLLADRIIERLNMRSHPSHGDFNLHHFLPPPSVGKTPWAEGQWHLYPSPLVGKEGGFQ